MKIKPLAVLLFLFNLNLATAQLTTFQKAYDASASCTSMHRTHDNGFVMVGTTADFDICLMKTDKDGNFLWKKVYGDTLPDYGQSVIETNDNGLLIAGTTTSFGLGQSDAYFIKTDQDGNLVWSKTYGGILWQTTTSVLQTSDGGYISVGAYANPDHDIYVFKTDSVGNLEWSRRFGGGGYDDGYSVLQTNDGGYLIAGDTYSFGVAIGFMDGLLIKIDASGNMLWSKTYGGTGNESIASIRSVKSGGYIMSGYTNQLGAWDDYVIRIDNSGNVLWSKKYGTAAWDRSTSIVETSDGGFVLTGTTATSFGVNEDGHLIKIDSFGNYKWGRKYDRSANDNFNSVYQKMDGGFVVSGNTLIQKDTQQVNQPYLLSLDPSGNAGCNQVPLDTIVNSFGTTVTSPYPVMANVSTSTVAATQVHSLSVPVSNICINGLGFKESRKEPANVLVYPNPARDFLIVRSYFLVYEFCLTNNIGQPVLKTFLNSPNAMVSVSRLPSGLYFYTLKTSEGAHTGKVLIR